jgi:hypothetical protein
MVKRVCGLENVDEAQFHCEFDIAPRFWRETLSLNLNMGIFKNQDQNFVFRRGFVLMRWMGHRTTNYETLFDLMFFLLQNSVIGTKISNPKNQN